MPEKSSDFFGVGVSSAVVTTIGRFGVLFGLFLNRPRLLRSLNNRLNIGRRTVVHLALHVLELQVVSVLFPRTTNSRIELAQRTQIDDVTLFESRCATVQEQFSSHLHLRFVYGGILARQLRQFLERTSTCGDYSAIVTFGHYAIHFALQKRLLDSKFQISHFLIILWLFTNSLLIIC